MSADNDGRVSQNADNPMNHVGLDLDNLELTMLDFLNIPSPHITPYHMLDIYKKIKETAGQYDGVVITHGTDTLEETDVYKRQSHYRHQHIPHYMTKRFYP